LNELVELFALLFVLYLFECLAWVPRRTVGFFAFFGRWRARIAFRPNASWSLAVIFGKPWPPLSPPWLAEPLPFAIEPQGITLPDGEQRRLTWEELAPLRARATRAYSGDLLLSTHACRSDAASLAETLERLRTSSAKKRETEIRRFLDKRFDVDVPRFRRKQFAKSVRVLRVLSNALWLAMFGGLGAAVLTRNMLILLCAAALSLVLWPTNSLAFARALRKQSWLPRAHWPDRAKRLVAMLSPLSGARAADTLAREAWADLEPVTVAAALLSPADLGKFARPLLVAAQPSDGDALAWWRTEIRQRIERVLARRQIDPAALLSPPVRENGRVQTYCPACLAQYEAGRQAGEMCPNESCPAIPLRAFGAETKTGAGSSAGATP
jgi:hypothetical protein